MTELAVHAHNPVGQRPRMATACRRMDARFLHSSYIVALCGFLLAQPFIRERGGVVFWVFTGLTIVYALTTARFVIVPPLLALTLVGLVYVGFSYLDVLPDAWTELYRRSFIPRQSYFVFLLYPMVLAASSMWSYAARSGRTAKFLGLILVTVIGIAPLVEGLFTGKAFLRAYAGFTSGGLGNARLMLYLAIAYFLLVRLKDISLVRFWTLVVVGAMVLSFFYLVDEPQYQNMIALGVLVLLTVAKPHRRLIAVVALAAVVMYVALIPIAERVYERDQNTGYRLVTTRDAIKGFVQSYGLGVGFGKEVVSGEYDDLGFQRDPMTTDGSDLLVQGVHNSFAQEFMRMGLLGGSCLVWLFFFTCLPPRDGPRGLRRHIAVVYLALLTSVMTNVALESPTYLVGIAFALSYILVTKDRLLFQRSGSSRVEKPCNMCTQAPKNTIAGVDTREEIKAAGQTL